LKAFSKEQTNSVNNLKKVRDCFHYTVVGLEVYTMAVTITTQQNRSRTFGKADLFIVKGKSNSRTSKRVL
jgi:hypothetical protein